VLAAAGDCIVCHTAPGGVPNAGGREMATPFGTVVTTNLTPDVATGIGAWSFSAFQRAMREGVSRDGKHLYPAFPYTAFTQTSDDDLTALYAYLMAQPAVVSNLPETKLAFPFSVRPLMALWNALYLTPGTVPAVATQSAVWNRGAYLVNGLGHCGGCHTERNALGAEQGGSAYLGGAMVDGWEAPPLTSLSHAPVPWTESQLFSYLRFGNSAEHGNASGPMAPVVQQLGQLPEADVRAMAVYLASFNTPSETVSATALIAQSAAQEPTRVGPAQRLFTTACGACHHDGDGPVLLGQNIALALNSNLHSDRPDNLLRVILEGIREPATKDIGFMPAFRHHLDDAQVAQLAAWMRQRFAPGKPPWRDLEAASARARAETRMVGGH
jgi:nicotinate dehydrogenase subunit B